MRYLLLILAIMFQTVVMAQVDPEPMPTENRVPMKTIMPQSNTLLGKVVGLENNKPVQAASVQLITKVPLADGGRKDSVIALSLSESNGDFRFEKLPFLDSITIKISSVGHSLTETTYPFATGSGGQRRGFVEKDVGNIILVRAEQKLEGVVVTGKRSALQLGIDKKVFDVSQSITTTGGTAVDVMKNIPSLSVDVDGNVTLRNSSPTIFVDGRPTILTLDQIPADNIDRIELVTNPSAKYDASSGGGIINVILKKNRRRGLNGRVSLSGGLPEMYGANANLNLRQGKVNFFVSGSYHAGGGKSKGSSDRINKSNGIISNYFNQESTSDRDREFKSIRGGLDFFIDNRNTITFTQGYRQGTFSGNEIQSQEYLDAGKNLVRFGDRKSYSSMQFTRNSSGVLFTHKFPKADKKLDISVDANYGNNTNVGNITNTFFNPDGTENADPSVVRNGGANKSNQVTAQVDFTNPIDEHTKIEAGLRGYINDHSSYFNTFSVRPGGETKLPLSNNYKYSEEVYAAYFTYTGMMGSIGYQLGLRGEYSKFSGTLIDSAQSFGYEYPSGLGDIWDGMFPSVFLSKKISENDELQLNYSRRINRPRFWQISPFIDINDPLNIQQGNPELRPEFRNSFEFNYSKNYGRGSNFLATLYYRNVQGDITRYSDTISSAQYDKLQNSGIDPNAILNTYINAKSNNYVGMELVLQQKFSPNFDVTPSVSFSYRKVNAEVGKTSLSNEGFDWQGKLTANYKIKAEKSSLFNDMSFQTNFNYESPSVIPQGKNLENYSVDLAIKKPVFGRNGAITFSINDLFDTNRRGVIYDTDSFYQESYRRWRVRSFRLSFSYNFGNSDFGLFKRHSGGGGGGEDYGGGGGA